MQTTYDGEHSIIVDNNDLWTHFGLVPASRPYVVLPEVKTNIIEVPGANGSIDMTESLLGYPTYGNRSGSWNFNVAHDKIDMSWDLWFSQLASFLHGKRRQVILKDDRSYYYEGRLSISDYSVGKNFSTVSIGYDLDPFKWMIWSTTEDWLWDPFDLIYGKITRADFKNIPVVTGQTTYRQWSQNELGQVPVIPTFTVTLNSGNDLTLNWTNSSDGYGIRTYVLPAGVTRDPQIEFACPSPEDRTDVAVVGNGTISIDFRPGRL